MASWSPDLQLDVEREAAIERKAAALRGEISELMDENAALEARVCALEIQQRRLKSSSQARPAGQRHRQRKRRRDEHTDPTRAMALDRLSPLQRAAFTHFVLVLVCMGGSLQRGDASAIGFAAKRRRVAVSCPNSLQRRDGMLTANARAIAATMASCAVNVTWSTMKMLQDRRGGAAGGDATANGYG